MRYLMGLDQGGGKTLAVVGDVEGRILGAGRGPGGCHAITGLGQAMDGAFAAMAGALEAASLGMERIGLLAAGMTGADWPEEYDLLRSALCRRTDLAVVKVCNDCIAAMRGGTEAPCGAVVCAGTGFNAGVVAPDGREFIFGYYVEAGDQGGAALARDAFEAVYAAETGLGPPTSLTGKVLARYGLPTVEVLCRAANAGAGGVDAQLAVPLVFEAAAEGDAAAARIAARFGRRAGEYAAAGLRRFGLEKTAVDVVLSGGVFKSRSPVMLQALETAVSAAAPRARLVDAAYEPVVGALLLALDEAHGRPLPARVLENLAQSAAAWGLTRG